MIGARILNSVLRLIRPMLRMRQVYLMIHEEIINGSSFHQRRTFVYNHVLFLFGDSVNDFSVFDLD